MIICSCCKKQKPQLAFNKANTKRGYQRYCKECQSHKFKDWSRAKGNKYFAVKSFNEREKDRTKSRKRHNEYLRKRKKDPMYRLIHNLRIGF